MQALRFRRSTHPGRVLARSLGLAALVALGVHAAAPSRAAVMEWSGELSLGLGAVQTFGSTATGVATLNDGLALETLALSGGLEASTVIPISDPIVTAGGLVSVRASASLGAGTFRFDPFGAGGLPELTEGLPLRGALRLCLFYTGCNSGSLTVPLTRHGTRGVGLGGPTIVKGTLPPRISLVGAPWTLHTASVLLPTDVPTFNDTALPASTTAFAFGTLHGPLSFTWSAAATWSSAGGSIQLVTPVRVLGLAEVPVGGFGRLSLHFVPEPTRGLVWTAAALAAAVLGLARLRPAAHRSHVRRTPCAPSPPAPPDAPSRHS